MHRAHHRYVETPLDPHSPVNGLYQAYAFFRHFEYPAHIDPAKMSPDLAKDPLYAFLEANGDWRKGYALCVAICILFRLALLACFGWTVALASLTGAILALNGPLLLNIICHIPKLGYRNYATEDLSVNVWWMAVFCLGEGWHNNHHQYPGSSRLGLLKYELDPGWALLKVLRRLGLAQSLNEPALAVETVAAASNVSATSSPESRELASAGSSRKR
jgi:stearoyl-CoA desaturase (delta-9 desaturase)